MDLRPDSSLRTVGDVVLVMGPDDSLVGGFLPPWARDSAGRQVPTSYTVEGNVLTQHIPHRGKGFSYPIVGDPLYKNGMIKRVNFETWSNGGYVLQAEVTTLARATRVHDPALVIKLGYEDLVEHFPRFYV